MYKRIFWIFLVLFVCPYTAFLQDTHPLDGYGIDANLLAGKIIPHNYKFPPIPALSTGLDISIIKQTSGKKEWQQRRNYPLVGLGLTYINYGLNEVYGQCIGIYPFVPLTISKRKNLVWDCKLGIGLGYITRKYERHPTWDTINNLIGSHLNNFTFFSTDLRYQLNEHLALQAGINVSHISNGSFRMPNLGVNLATAHVGIRYFPYNANPKRIVSDLPKLSNRWLLQLRMGIGFTEAVVEDGPLYKTYMPSLFVSRRYGGRNKMFAGFDYSYYESAYAFLRNNEVHPGEERKYATQASVFVGNEFLIGRFGLVVQVCIPFKYTYDNDGKYFEKLGYNFYIIKGKRGLIKELTVHTYIKADRFEADMIEFGMGMSL